jgi:hypothetical protein
MKFIFLILLYFILFSCICSTSSKQGERKSARSSKQNDFDPILKIIPDETSKSNPVRLNDKQENQVVKERIEKKYGEQWSFCTCVKKGDSLSKAVAKENLSDVELNKLLVSFDEIEKKCQFFRLQDVNRTPEDRQKHADRVKKCLSSKGK